MLLCILLRLLHFHILYQVYGGMRLLQPQSSNLYQIFDQPIIKSLHSEQISSYILTSSW